MTDALTLVTWNLKGSEGPDLEVVAAHLRDVDARIVVLQEVQRRQATRLAELLGAVAHAWAFKHWPIIVPAEGLAVLSLAGPVTARGIALSHRWRFWHYRRRIALVATTMVDGWPIRLIDVHLSVHGGSDERRREVETVCALPEVTGPDDGAAVLVVGDMNADPSAPALGTFASVGLTDAWRAAGAGDGRTCWPSDRREGRPARRLDAVFASGSATIHAASLPDEAAFPTFAAVSDHLPLTVRFAPAAP
jgi:endonuclease/exonuclease/phosphatase family metal-dependent hydrolase